MPPLVGTFVKLKDEPQVAELFDIAQGYDSMLLLAQAISQANSLEGRHIREALEDLRTPVQGVIMTYLRPYARDQHETLTHPQQIHMGEVRDGRVVFAYAQDRQRAMQS